MALGSPRRSARASKRPRRSYADLDALSDQEVSQRQTSHSPASSVIKDDLQISSDDNFPAESVDVTPTPSRLTSTPAKKYPNSRKKQNHADEDSSSTYNGPDLEVITTTGTAMMTKRVQSRSGKGRSTRAEWAHGAYEPPDLALASTLSEINEDQHHQPSATSSTALGLPWPKDGLVRTRLDSTAFSTLKKERYRFWCSQAGWIPKEGLFDISWWPGKPVGYKACQQRTEWVQQQGKTARQSQDKVGWPFTSPVLDLTSSNTKMLSRTAAQSFLEGTAISSLSEPNAALRHPTIVARVNVTRSMNTAVQDKKAKKKVNEIIDEDDFAKHDATGAVAEDEVSQEDLNAKQQPIDPADAKFAGITNIGMREPIPVTGETLEISVGPPGQQHNLAIGRGVALRLDSIALQDNPSHILNAGGHVYDLGWAPIPIHLNCGEEYFAVSAASTTSPRTFIGQKSKAPLPGSIQIWSVSPDVVRDKTESKGQSQLRLVLCHDLGMAWKLSWCPVGHSYLLPDTASGSKRVARRLGLLAGCFEDGSTSIFSVPYPQDVTDFDRTGSTDIPFLKIEPVLRFSVPCSASNCLSWAGGEMLAVGTSDGHVVVWNVGEHLRSATPPTNLIPHSYVRVHRAAITSLSWIMLPPINTPGIAKHDMIPTQIFTVSMDGWTCLVDLLDPTSSASLERSRSVHYASSFVPHAGGVLAHENGDGSIAYYSLRAEELFRTRIVSHTPARVLSLSSSSFHPMLAAGTAHGEVKSCNVLRTTKRSGKQHTQRIHLPIYQLRLDRSTGQLSIVHNIEPQMANTYEHKSWKISTWSSILNITAVQWNPNFGRANLLLSASAAGMVKIDCVASPFT